MQGGARAIGCGLSEDPKMCRSTICTLVTLSRLRCSPAKKRPLFTRSDVCAGSKHAQQAGLGFTMDV